jgi:hypothetical protein
MDTHCNTNDSGWTDQSSIPNSFSTKWFEAQINVWARRIDLSLRRIFELGSHWAPAPVVVAAASLLEERGWAGPGLRCVSCHVGVGRSGAAMRVLSRLSCHVGKTDGKSPIESSRSVTLSGSMSASFAIACRRSGSNGVP